MISHSMNTCKSNLMSSFFGSSTKLFSIFSDEISVPEYFRICCCVFFFFVRKYRIQPSHVNLDLMMVNNKISYQRLNAVSGSDLAGPSNCRRFHLSNAILLRCSYQLILELQPTTLSL